MGIKKGSQHEGHAPTWEEQGHEGLFSFMWPEKQEPNKRNKLNKSFGVNSKAKKVKGAAAAAEAAAGDAAMEAALQGKGSAGAEKSAKAGKGAEAATAGKGKGKEGGKGKGRRRRRRRGKGKGKGKTGKGAAGEDYDYAGDSDENMSFPLQVVDRMQDIHILGGSFIESVGKSISEAKPQPVVDNVQMLDAADTIVLIFFLTIFLAIFGVINYYFQRFLFFYIRKWVRMDPHEPFEEPTPDCTDDGVPVFHKVIFFPEDTDNFQLGLGEKPKTVDVKRTQAYRFLRDVLNDACCTVEMAMFSITSEDIAELLLCLDRKGVQIQVICDEAVLPLDGSQVPKLQQHGIDVAIWPTSSGYMHHKFIIIDSKTVIYASFNMSNNAFFYNSEDAIVTNDPRFVRAFQAEFSNIRYLISLFPY